MNALEILREMHVDAKSAFQEIHGAAPDKRGGLWASLRPKLQLHEQIEERFVYQPVAHDFGASFADWENQHMQQVHEAETLMDRIGELKPRESRWLYMVSQLQTALEQHIAMEEGQIWPMIERQWGPDKLEEVGNQVHVARTTGNVGAAMTGAIGQAGEAIKNVGDRITGRDHETHAA